MAVEDGVPSNITWKSTIEFNPKGSLYRDRAAEFNGSSSKINLGSAADIDNLVELTASMWIYPRSAGGASSCNFFMKGSQLRFETLGVISGTLGLWAKIIYSVTSAESQKNVGIPLNAWSHLAMTYSESGDRMIHFFINGTEVTGYATQTPSDGVRISDAANSAYLGSDGGTKAVDGCITSFLLHNRALTATELKWISQIYWPNPGLAYLQATEWEARATVNPAKLTHGAVVFDLEGEYDTHYSAAFPIFQANSVQGTLALIVNLLDTPGRMTTAQVKAMRDAGWEIASLSMDHSDPLGWSEPNLRSQLADSRAALQAAFNVPVTDWSWPNSRSYARQRVVALEYYKAAVGAAEQGPFNMVANLNYRNLLYETLGSAQALVDAAYTNNTILVLLAHEVSGAIPALLTALIPYIKAKPVPILTLAQALAKLSPGPGIPIRNGMSIMLTNLDASHPRTLWKLQSLTPGHYYVWFHCYLSGLHPTVDDIVPWAGHDTITNLCQNITFIRQALGRYLVIADFTLDAPAAIIWGAQVPVLIHADRVPWTNYPQLVKYPP